MDDDNSPRLQFSTRWLTETQGISDAAGGVLVILVGLAARAGLNEIAVSPENLVPHVMDADRPRLQACIAELRLKGLILPVRPGVFRIAPGLWKVAPIDMDDTEFIPYG